MLGTSFALDGRPFFVVKRQFSSGSIDELEHDDPDADPDYLLELEDDSEDDLLNDGLEQVGGGISGPTPSATPIPLSVTNVTSEVQRRERQHPPRIDAHRFSRANLEDSGDLELDAILGELCALETQFDFELASKSSGFSTSSCISSQANTTTTSNKPSIITHTNIGLISKMQPQQTTQSPPQRQHTRNNSGGMKQKFDTINIESENSKNITRTDSPDNDSAFSDNVSMLSSESSASSGASGSGPTRHLTQTEQAAKIKAEKIKMALEKIKEANVKKLFMKAFMGDSSSKSLLVDEKMSVSHVTRMLADKNHVQMDPKWAVIEHIPDLYMERIYEDDEMLVDNLLLWTRESKNKILFLERLDKYDLFMRPERYLLCDSSPRHQEYDDETRNTLIEEFFSNSSSPEVEGALFLKSEGKKAWKKFYFVLRASGLYYCPKGKSSKSSKDLVCLVTLESNQVYHGVGWRKKYKAPTDWCFALKHPGLQAKSSKYIKYLCAEDPQVLHKWVMGIRIAKGNRRLYENYKSLVEDMAQEDIDILASSRSFSIASMASGSRGASQATTPSSESRSLDSCLAPSLATSYLEDGTEDAVSSTGSSQDTPVNTLGRTPVWRQDSIKSASSSSSSGCLSERSSTGTPTGEHGFESEFPQGTIKRKPSSAPKLPLTTTTRLLVKECELEDTVDSTPSSRTSTLRRSIRRSLDEEVSTLRRRNSASQSQSRSSVSSNLSSALSIVSSSLPSETVVEEVSLELPLPPPPSEIDCNTELLPPPPPEMLASTLSLNSFPPPPDEAILIMSTDDLMTASIISLPPPPPPSSAKPSSPINGSLPPPPTSPKPKIVSHLYQQPSSPPAVAPKPWRDSDSNSNQHTPYSSEYEQIPLNNGWHNDTSLPPPPISPPVNPIYISQPQKSPQKKVKRITFQDDVEDIPPVPLSPNKPLPPKRSDSTRLSASPGRLTAPGCTYTPPRAFLSNLQRVMQKKWQVAQKCRDFEKMPHEVLGFRDPVLLSETERNVGAWIQEHYGSLYENLSPNGSPILKSDSAQIDITMASKTLGANKTAQPNNNNLDNRNSQTVPIRKKPPPLPPKRSDKTHLSMIKQ